MPSSAFYQRVRAEERLRKRRHAIARLITVANTVQQAVHDGRANSGRRISPLSHGVCVRLGQCDGGGTSSKGGDDIAAHPFRLLRRLVPGSRHRPPPPGPPQRKQEQQRSEDRQNGRQRSAPVGCSMTTFLFR
jgi:hypothetical protein